MFVILCSLWLHHINSLFSLFFAYSRSMIFRIVGIGVSICPLVLSTSLIMCYFMRLYSLAVDLPSSDSSWGFCSLSIPSTTLQMSNVIGSYLSRLLIMSSEPLHHNNNFQLVLEIVGPPYSPSMASTSLDTYISDRFETPPFRPKFRSINEIMVLSSHLIPQAFTIEVLYLAFYEPTTFKQA